MSSSTSVAHPVHARRPECISNSFPYSKHIANVFLYFVVYTQLLPTKYVPVPVRRFKPMALLLPCPPPNPYSPHTCCLALAVDPLPNLQTNSVSTTSDLLRLTVTAFAEKEGEENWGKLNELLLRWKEVRCVCD